MTILGIGGLHDDPACAILRNGHILAAVEEEKLRHPSNGAWPRRAIETVLRTAGVTEVNCLALVRPFGPAIVAAAREQFPDARLVMVDHHAAHAAAAYYLSGFDDATILTLDRYGDARCGATWRGQGTRITMESEAIYPDSLGELYSRTTQRLGFQANADEHKVQWLSAEGQPLLKDAFRALLPTPAANWGRLDWAAFDALNFAGIRPEDVAASLQAALEEMVLGLAGDSENLCVAGGVFYNAMLVAALENSGRWKRVFVQPAAGDPGAALGAACHAWHQTYGQESRVGLPSLALGPSFKPEEIKQVLENCKLNFRTLLTSDEVITRAVALLNDNAIIAWMQDRMEFGPRALGNRSILASPRDPYASENLNTFIKHREGFRKFAASVPAEVASEYFEFGENARFLATVARVKPAWRKTFASALLGEDRIRLHVVEAEANPFYHRLLHAAGLSSGLPVLYNTSFNLFGDPLVCTPRDAVRSFYSSGIDALFVGAFLLEK